MRMEAEQFCCMVEEWIQHDEDSLSFLKVVDGDQLPQPKAARRPRH
jgi:hypothetical protein